MELPYEILVYIFKYLPKSDRKAASETCQSWYSAVNDYSFLKKKVVVLYKADLNEDDSPLQMLENSNVVFENLLFKEVEISNKLNTFWNRYGENIRSLTLQNCDVREKVFVYILQKCTNLETLNIENCKDLFMSGCLLEGKTEGLLRISLSKLKSLSLSGNQYLTDALFSRFVTTAPNLEELNLSACSLHFHLGLVKRFYPPGSNIFDNPSENVLTFYFISQFLMNRAKNIKHLLFSKTLIDSAALKLLSETEHLKLKYLQLYSCDQLTNTGISALTTHQPYLKDLDIGLCIRVTDQSLVYICNNLVNLESLNIQRCTAVTDLGITELRKLKKLKKLNISKCEFISKDGIEKGICFDVNHVLEDLDINSLNLDQDGLIMISDRLPHLHTLNISYCFNAVTDKSIQIIFKNQVYLHTLNLSYCDKVSDAGLTGMGKIDTDNEDDGAVMTTYNDSNSINKIYLGSRAEEEIVRDAKRKHDVMRMCEKLSMDSFSGFSLARIKGLKELNIRACKRITDVSLTYAFSFKELVNLNLSHCQQITHDGIKHLVRSCPSIEFINLSECYDLKDESVIEIVKGLHRLQQLELMLCYQLTDKTLEGVKAYCRKLKFLDVQGCRKMSAELACTIGVLPTMHTVLISKPGHYTSREERTDHQREYFFQHF